MTNPPLVSVLMSTYNDELYLKESIESILRQTFTNFEFLIINDGSSDNTESIILSYTDPRIKYVKNECNIGLTGSLNKGIALCQGMYIARMDADDISLPERLEKQYNFMRLNPSVAVCGTMAYYTDSKGNLTGQKWTRATSSAELKVYNTFSTLQFLHATALFRSDILKKYKYNTTYKVAEDNYLFAQIVMDDCQTANLNKFLYCYRIHGDNKTSDNLTFSGKDAAMYDVYNVNIYELTKILGYKPDIRLVDIYHAAFSLCQFDQFLLDEFKMLLELIKDSNQKSKMFDQELLSKILHNKWHEVVYNKGGKNALCLLLNSDLFVWSYATLKQLRRVLKQKYRLSKRQILGNNRQK